MAGTHEAGREDGHPEIQLSCARTSEWEIPSSRGSDVLPVRRATVSQLPPWLIRIRTNECRRDDVSWGHWSATSESLWKDRGNPDA